jgi:hypothetical protein
MSGEARLRETFEISIVIEPRHGAEVPVLQAPPVVQAAALSNRLHELRPGARRQAIRDRTDSGPSPSEVRVTTLLNFFDELRRHLP